MDVVFPASWTVITADKDLDQDQSDCEQSIREEKHQTEEIRTTCPLPTQITRFISCMKLIVRRPICRCSRGKR